MINIQTFCRALKFAAHASAQKDIRYYLLGVCFEFKNDTLSLYGTDGARVAGVTMRANPITPFEARFVLPNAAVKQVLAAYSKSVGDLEVSVESVPNKPPLVQIGGLKFQALEGVFPDIRRVVPGPNRPRGGMPPLDAGLVASACAALLPLAQPASKKLAPTIFFESTGLPSDTVLIHPATISDPLVSEAFVVISPIRP